MKRQTGKSAGVRLTAATHLRDFRALTIDFPSITLQVSNSRMRGNGGILLRVISRSLFSSPKSFSPPPPPSFVAAAPRRRSYAFWAGVGLGVGGLVGAAAGYDQIRKSRTIVANTEEQGPIILPKVPEAKVLRSVRYATDASGLKVTLFQYQTCPFCCKVRTMLDFFGISYDVVEVNSIKRTETKWSKDYKKVPILVVETPEGDVLQLNDSSMIVSALYSYLVARQGGQNASSEDSSLLGIVKFYPTIKYNDESGKTQAEIMNKYFLMLDTSLDGRTTEAIVEERKWRKWADDVFVHMLSPNIYRSFAESLDSFNYFDKVGEWEKVFSSWERSVIIYLGATAMYLIGKRLKKRHHLKDDVRQSLYDETDVWVANLKKKGGPFMGGSSPNLADLAVFGVLSSIEGCQAFKDLTSHSKAMGQWYFNVKSELKSL